MMVSFYFMVAVLPPPGRHIFNILKGIRCSIRGPIKYTAAVSGEVNHNWMMYIRNCPLSPFKAVTCYSFPVCTIVFAYVSCILKCVDEYFVRLPGIEPRRVHTNAFIKNLFP